MTQHGPFSALRRVWRHGASGQGCLCGLRACACPGQGTMPRAVRDTKEKELREAAAKEGVKLSTDANQVEVGGYNP